MSIQTDLWSKLKKLIQVVPVVALLLGSTMQTSYAHGSSTTFDRFHPPFVTPYACDPDNTNGLISDFTRNPLTGRVVYRFDGNGENGNPNFEYGCDFGGLTFGNVNGRTNFQSISYQLNPSTECNNQIGPNVYINYTRNGVATTTRIICNAAFATGTTSDGFTIYNYPASAFGILSTDTINQVAIAFFPGSLGDFGPAFMQNITYNGSLVGRQLRTSSTCPTFVQVFEVGQNIICDD